MSRSAHARRNIPTRIDWRLSGDTCSFVSGDRERCRGSAVRLRARYIREIVEAFVGPTNSSAMAV